MIHQFMYKIFEACADIPDTSIVIHEGESYLRIVTMVDGLPSGSISVLKEMLTSIDERWVDVIVRDVTQALRVYQVDKMCEQRREAALART